MVRAIALTVCSLLVSAIGASAAPTGNNSTVNTLQMTVNEILNAPIAAANFADLAFKPINAGSNSTIIAAIPEFNAPVLDLPTIKASISSAAATATVAAQLTPTDTTTGNSKSPRDLEKRRIPPADFQYWDIDSTPHPSYPEVNYNQWVAAITKGCRSFFDPVNPPTSPLVYLYEGSFDSRPVGPLSHPFTFSYHVRSNPSTPYDAYYAYSADKCIAELKIRMYICMAPDSNGWMTALGSCWDSTGFTSFPDGNSPIWWTITSPTH